MWEEMQEPISAAWEHGRFFMGPIAVGLMFLWGWWREKADAVKNDKPAEPEPVPVIGGDAQEVIGNICNKSKELFDGFVSYGCVVAGSAGEVYVVEKGDRNPALMADRRNWRDVEFKKHEHEAIAAVVRAHLLEIGRQKKEHLRTVSTLGEWQDREE